ncbi:MAG: hypothetical protein ACI9WU_001161 [Myxococcota bacterium]|jgi:hypothetical protein
MVKKERRVYSAAEQRDAIALSAEVGPTETGERLSIPVGAVNKWTLKSASDQGRW